MGRAPARGKRTTPSGGPGGAEEAEKLPAVKKEDQSVHTQGTKRTEREARVGGADPGARGGRTRGTLKRRTGCNGSVPRCAAPPDLYPRTTGANPHRPCDCTL